MCQYFIQKDMFWCVGFDVFYFLTIRQPPQARGVGAPMIDRLANEHTAVNNNPLDESLGESYHRHSNQTAQRCSAAHEPYILGSVHRSQHLDTSANFVNQCPTKKSVWKFEWKHFLNAFFETFDETTMDAMQKWHTPICLDACIVGTNKTTTVPLYLVIPLQTRFMIWQWIACQLMDHRDKYAIINM